MSWPPKIHASPYKRLLFIEDDEIDALISKKILFHVNAVEEIVLAPSGHHALAYLELYGEGGGIWPDLIFINVELPRLDGFYFMEIFQERGYLSQPSVKLFMYTCSDDPRYPLEAQRLGASGYIRKPISFESINDFLFSSQK